jgi:hypothetical protein
VRLATSSTTPRGWRQAARGGRWARGVPLRPSPTSRLGCAVRGESLWRARWPGTACAGSALWAPRGDGGERLSPGQRGMPPRGDMCPPARSVRTAECDTMSGRLAGPTGCGLLLEGRRRGKRPCALGCHWALDFCVCGGVGHARVCGWACLFVGGGRGGGGGGCAISVSVVGPAGCSGDACGFGALGGLIGCVWPGATQVRARGWRVVGGRVGVRACGLAVGQSGKPAARALPPLLGCEVSGAGGGRRRVLWAPLGRWRRIRPLWSGWAGGRGGYCAWGRRVRGGGGGGTWGLVRGGVRGCCGVVRVCCVRRVCGGGVLAGSACGDVRDGRQCVVGGPLCVWSPSSTDR